MLLTKEIEVILCSNRIRHFTEQGYTILKSPDRDGNMTVSKGTKLIVKVSDLPSNSNERIKVLCDYCQKNIILKTYSKYLKQREIVNKDACKKCQSLKQKDVFQKKYGSNVLCAHNIPRISEKIRQKRRRHYIKDIGTEFEKKNYILLSKVFTSVDEYLEFICKIHKEYGVQKVKYSNFRNDKGGCKLCRYEKVSGENAYQWKGGVSPLQTYVRDKLTDWKYKSFDECKRGCILTGYRRNLVIHHKNKNFKDILNETLVILDLELHDKINRYSVNQLGDIVNKCSKLHFQYGYGLVLRKEIHELYHRYYSRKDNNEIEFEDFRNKYVEGKFDNELPEKLKSYNSIKRLQKNQQEM
jgi:hypothetical protein